MDFNKYCKKCGNKVEEIDPIDGKRAYKCGCQEEPLKWNEVIAGFTKDARINQLKAMHNLMIEANDEYIYMSWIYLVPDCPNNDDFEEIAINDELFNECFDKFVQLIARPGNRY